MFDAIQQAVVTAPETLHVSAAVFILGCILYWVPLLICAVGYTIRTRMECAHDIELCHTASYKPTVTVGHVCGRLVVSAIPGLNLIAAVFDLGPRLIADIFKYFRTVFTIPLITKKAPTTGAVD